MDIVLRATVMFAVIFALLRLMGKRELAEMTPFEFVTLIVIGDLIQQAVTHSDYSITGASLAVATFAFWGLVLNWVSNKSRKAERLIDGEPAVIIRHGELLHANLRHNRLTKSEVESEMRLAGITKLAEVSWGILETNGKISFIEADGGSSRPAAGQDNPAA